MNTKFSEAVKQLGSSNIVLAKLVRDKLSEREVVREAGKVWVTPEGMDKLRLALSIPLAVPTRYKARVLQAANNPKWVYVKIDGMDNRHLCLMPRKLQGNVLAGKYIWVDAITDANGTTYRHEHLGA